MNEDNAKADKETDFSRQVAAQAERKLKAQRGRKWSIWLGLGVSGLIGFSVTVPALLGTALGMWIDKVHPSRISWTLTLLILGLIVGCLNAWYWIDSQHKEIEEDSNE